MSSQSPGSKQKKSQDNKKGKSPLDGLQFFFLLTWGAGTYLLFFKGEAVNLKQLLFRVGLFAVGFIGSLVVMLVRLLLQGEKASSDNH